jgi:hypothetical protein
MECTGNPLKYIGNFGRQDAEFDNSLAENAEATPPLPSKEISLPLLALLIVLPGGLFILGGIMLHKYLKG